MEVIIMRGLPGSGKDTWIRRNYPEGSADSFHMVNGVYQYDPKKAGEAHNACLRKFLSICIEVKESLPSQLIVSNTNSTIVEIAPYYRVAECLESRLLVRGIAMASLDQ